MILLFLFFILFVTVILLQNRKYISASQTNQVLVLFCVLFCLVAGLRSFSWADTMPYVYSFENESLPIWAFSFDSKSSFFDETGFFFLGFIVKTFTENTQIYLTFVSALTFFFLYKGIKEYSVYPLLGLLVYISRFFLGRNMMQIRAGLCYAIILFGVKFIYQKKIWHYLLTVFIAYQFHHSAILAIPVYFICNFIRLNKIHIVVGLILAFIAGLFYQGPIHEIVQDNATDLNIQDYVEGGSFVEGKGILNPLIYFQTALLLLYTYGERKLAPLSKYYYVVRDCYFYSTLILITFCTYSVLSGRTSTMFATMEISIIPSVIYLFHKRNRFLPLLICGLLLMVVFILGYPRNMQ